MATASTPPRTWAPGIVACALLALGLKLFIALTTYGTNDVTTWQHFLDGARSLGGTALYRATTGYIDNFNHPPLMVGFLLALGALTQATHLPFPFWLRLPGILADVGSLWLVAAIARQEGHPLAPGALCWLALAPTSLLISGFHGNTDPIFMCFLLAAVYATARRSAWGAGLAFGLATSVKIVPVVFLPMLLLAWARGRDRLTFCGVAALTWLIGALPVLMGDPIFILRRLLSYQGLYGYWGLSWFFARVPLKLARLDALYAASSRYLLLGAIIAGAIALARRQPRPSLLVQGGLTAALFLTLAPGFGVQYLAWLVPWVVVLGTRVAATYFLASGAYLFLGYQFYAGGFPWVLADTTKRGVWEQPLHLQLAALACWAVVGWLAWRFWRAPGLSTDGP